MKGKQYLYKVCFSGGDEAILTAKDPLSAAIMASSDRIRAKKNHHVIAIEMKGERLVGCINFIQYID
jgi:hypothetical protein